MAGVTRRLTKADVPTGSRIGVLHDVHIPHHDEKAVRLAIECMEAEGVTHVVLLGDIADCGPASRHPDKRAAAHFDEGDLKESIAPGYWIYEWARTRPCYYIRGNHEKWVDDAIEKSAEMRGSSTMSIMGLWEDGNGWEVFPPKSVLTLGNLALEHGDKLFPSGNGGQNPAQRMRSLVPDRTTLIGHLHRMFSMRWSTPDEHGIYRTRMAVGGGHMSLLSSHEKYAGYVSWQQSFEIIDVWEDGNRPRFNIHEIEIHRDKRGRPIFNFGDRTYR